MTPRDELIDRFIALFAGNPDAYGTEEGGCARIYPGVWGLGVKIEEHLTGQRTPIGVYPMDTMIDNDQTTIGRRSGPFHWVVHWGCVDFDEGEEESWVHASNVHKALAAFDIEGWIERSRSKGYHVWVFAQEWTDARLMREALLAACQLVEAPTKEINPKQTELKQKPDGEWQLGNYVRLPYPGALAADPIVVVGHMDGEFTPRRVVIHSDGGGYHGIVGFVDSAWASRVGVDRLVALAAHYTPTQTPFTPKGDWGDTVLDGDAVSRLAGKSLVIFSEGPLEGSGRGHTLFKLARYLKEDGRHSYAEAMELVRDADSRWGKFHDRPDCETRLLELLERAWGLQPEADRSAATSPP